MPPPRTCPVSRRRDYAGLRSELHEDCKIDAIFDFLQVRSPQPTVQAAITGCRGSAVAAHEQRWVAIVAARRRNSARSRPIRHIRGAMIELPPERDVLARHPVKCS